MNSHHRKELSFCRMCMGHCGVEVTLDEERHLLDIRGDHGDPQTLGYACFKGMRSADAHNSEQRILKPLKRAEDGSFSEIPLEQALDEIAEKIQRAIATGGPESVAGYKGGGAFFTSSSSMMLNEFLKALGSPKAFSSVTIDQSSKAVTAGRMGVWPAGRDPFHRGDVFLVVGHNPLVSLSSSGFDTRNPVKRLKQAKARGMKLIVIDPRRTETARYADVFLQPLPGEDCSVLAAILHIILEEGWHDRDFCERYALDLEALRQAVAEFPPSLVARRADVPEETLRKVAAVFARDSDRGAAIGATGPDMSPHGNLAEHLLECLNVTCGRYLREGEIIDNPGVIGGRQPRRAEVIPATRSWERAARSRVGDYGLIGGELPTGTLPDEILTQGPGQVKCLIVHGGNPVSAIPEQRKVVRAFEALDLLVSIEPFMTVTAQLSHYILPPTLQYERADLPIFLYETLVEQDSYTRFTPAVADPPAGSEVKDDHHYLIGLAQRLGIVLEHFGQALDMDHPPSTDELLAISARHASIPFEALVGAERGVRVEGPPQRVEAGDPDSPHRFSLLPLDVAEELRSVSMEWDAAKLRPTQSDAYPYRLAVRRLRDGLNSAGLELPAIKERIPFNLAHFNPDDMGRENLGEGEQLTIESAHGSIEAVATADDTIRRGVISIAHGFGGLPDGDDKYIDRGSSTNLLLSLGDDRESINAMPRMSGIPVGIRSAHEARA
ncbi:molybdopterin-dependent oxidoreductase [Myxococcota bacterium]|nr:molybdopterin-dependent oxidoreductase [Myxococcota bacterium]